MNHTTHQPEVMDKTNIEGGGAANADTVRHVRLSHPDLARTLIAQPDIHHPDAPVGTLEKFSQTYLSDCHEADHDARPPASIASV